MRLIAAIVLLAPAMCAGIALASQLPWDELQRRSASHVPAVEPAVAVTEPGQAQDETLTVPTVTIESHRHNVNGVANPHSTKRFVCGPVHGNDVGARNSDCYWQ